MRQVPLRRWAQRLVLDGLVGVNGVALDAAATWDAAATRNAAATWDSFDVSD